MHCDLNEVVPVVADSSHIAELALNALTLDKRVTSDDAGLPVALALWTVKSSLIQAFIVAVLTSACR